MISSSRAYRPLLRSSPWSPNAGAEGTRLVASVDPREVKNNPFTTLIVNDAPRIARICMGAFQFPMPELAAERLEATDLIAFVIRPWTLDGGGVARPLGSFALPLVLARPLGAGSLPVSDG